MKQLAQELAAETVEPRRAPNGGGALIVPPGGTEAVEHRRYSQLVNDLADMTYLDGTWTPSRIVDGIVARPALLDEWIAGTDSPRKLLQRMKRAGGGFTKADRGTEFHDWARKVTSARINIDEVPDEFRPAVAAYIVALADLGLIIVAVERFVVDDERRMAGTFDALVRDRDGRHYILDIKTGKLSHLGLVVQLYGYAIAPHYFTQGDAADGSQDVREPKPATETGSAYVAEVDIDAGTAKIRQVDLSAGPEAFALADAVHAIREVKSYGPALNTAKTRKAAVDAVFGETQETSTVDDAWRTMTRERLETIRDAGHLGDVAWPEGVPTLKAGGPITLAQAVDVDEALSYVEKLHELPFHPGGGPAGAVTPKPRTTRRRPKADEGAEVTHNDIGMLNARAALLTPTARTWVGAITDAAGRKGRPIRLTGDQGRPTERRLAIGNALLSLAEHDDDELVRVMLAAAMSTEVQPAHDLGEAFGSLTIAEAHRLAAIAAALDERRLTVTFDASGPSIAGDIDAAIAA